LAALEAKGLVYRGVLEPPKGKVAEDWEPVELTLFRSTRFGDDQDRPLRKSDGSWTYFAADAAYHLQKLEASDELINVWGADHTGTVKRTQAAVEALCGRPALDIKLVQMVRLLRGGEPVKMSKRSGSFVTLAEVVDEVGKDVVRFTMLTRKNDAQMDFDFAKVVEASKDNPVFYVQYAHARICSLHRRAAEAGIDLTGAADLTLLDDEELALVRLAAQFPRVVEAAALAHEPHRIAFYLHELLRRSTRSGTRVTTTPQAFPPGTESGTYARAAGTRLRNRADCAKRPRHHGRQGGRGDAVMTDIRADGSPLEEDRLPWLEAVEGTKRSEGPRRSR
jgi:arginyl-tRNA synthetase